MNKPTFFVGDFALAVCAALSLQTASKTEWRHRHGVSACPGANRPTTLWPVTCKWRKCVLDPERRTGLRTQSRRREVCCACGGLLTNRTSRNQCWRNFSLNSSVASSWLNDRERTLGRSRTDLSRCVAVRAVTASCLHVGMMLRARRSHLVVRRMSGLDLWCRPRLGRARKRAGERNTIIRQ
jgi:hypothetical protein